MVNIIELMPMKLLFVAIFAVLPVVLTVLNEGTDSVTTKGGRAFVFS